MKLVVPVLATVLAAPALAQTPPVKTDDTKPDKFQLEQRAGFDQPKIVVDDQPPQELPRVGAKKQELENAAGNDVIPPVIVDPPPPARPSAHEDMELKQKNAAIEVQGNDADEVELRVGKQKLRLVDAKRGRDWVNPVGPPELVDSNSNVHGRKMRLQRSAGGQLPPIVPPDGGDEMDTNQKQRLDLDDSTGFDQPPIIIDDQPSRRVLTTPLTSDYDVPQRVVRVGYERRDLDDSAGFDQPPIIIDDQPPTKVKDLEKIQSAMLDLQDVVRVREVDRADFDALRSALEDDAQLQQYVDDMDDSVDISQKDLDVLWERIVDALLDDALDDLAHAARAGEWDPVRFRYARRMLYLRANAAQDAGASDEVADRLSALLQAMELDGADEAELRLALAKHRLQRSKELIQRTIGTLPPVIRLQVAVQRADLAKWSGPSN